MEKPTSIETLARIVREATDKHRAAEDAANAARRAETDALNALNRAQKEFDTAIAELKAAAPSSSDWATYCRSDKMRVVA